MEDKVLEIKELNIEFHDHNRPETVVHHLSFDLYAGEIMGIVGESGSGKTMSALAIAGLLSRHDLTKEGSILFQGENLLNCDRNTLRKMQGNDISMIFQEPMTSLNPVKRIGWQVEESLRLHTNLSKEERYKRAIDMLREVELEQPEVVYQKYPHQLSGGQRQRVMIAAAMICTPKLLLADEPTTALDVTVQEQIVKLLLKLNQKEKTSILFISHDLSLVNKLCKKVIVMQNGYAVETGTTQEIFEHPKEEYTKKLIAAIPGKDFMEKADVMEKEELLRVTRLNSFYDEKSTNNNFFAKKNRKQVLKNVEFSMYQGEILGLVGESGCGKSTLSKAILGMIKDYDGEIRHNTKNPQMVFQDPYSSLNPRKRIGWLLEEPLKLRGSYSKEEREKKVSEMLQKVGLSQEIAMRYPSELSGGQRQRVCIAKALILNPKFLIADEPVSALDVTIQEQVLELLKELHDELGIGILFISHDLRVVYKLCDHIMIMKQGEIVESGEINEVFSNPKNIYTKELLSVAGFLPK